MDLQENKITLVGSEKGGVGKTTIAFNMAVMRAIAGYNVLLVDTDRQGSSSMWSSLRSEAGLQPPLVCMQKFGKVAPDLARMSRAYEIIVDAGGQDSQELRYAIAVAHRWVIPVRPGQLDLLALAKMRALKKEVWERVEHTPETMVLMNAISPSTKEADEARAVLEEENEGEEMAGDLPVMAAAIVDRVAIRRAIRFNCAVVELPAKERSEAAVTEMTNVYEEIFQEKYRVA